MDSTSKRNKVSATRFIDIFNADDWDSISEVVAEQFVLTHPLAGTIQLGPKGMAAAWSGDKESVPDMWHPIPIMITEGDFLAVLLPTYGHFTGKPYHGVPASGKWMEYGMVNIVRLEEGKLVRAWFGMDPLVEMQQMGAAPSTPPRQFSPAEQSNVELFQRTINTTNQKHDRVTAFDDVVVAIGPPQHAVDTTVRRVEIYRNIDGSLKLDYTNEFTTNPPYGGDASADTEQSRSVVTRFIDQVLVGHKLEAIADTASKHLLLHSTAMPCEASFYGLQGLNDWLSEQWSAFPDLTFDASLIVAERDIVAVHWTARGTSQGSFLLLPPSGETIEFTGASMYRIEDDRIAEIWDVRNTLGIMRQLNPEMGGPH
ncbi:MAG: ester cyclase family protein [Anaerolineales bacterium]|jgi:predicted ester cyclase